MKKRFFLTMVFILSLSVVTYADNMKPKSINTVRSEIRREQGLKSNDKINSDKVSQKKLEELGDSVMEAMIGNSKVHDQMDKNMGGDGSVSLTSMHKRIGYNYLVGYPNGMMSNNRFRMMNNNNFDTTSYFSFGELIIGSLILILIVIFLFFIIKTNTRARIKLDTETDLDILKKRYAKGEISKDEFDKIKHDIGSFSDVK